MRGNGSIIGTRNIPTNDISGGVWSLQEQYIAKLNNSWPIFIGDLPVTANLARNFDASVAGSLYDSDIGGSPVFVDGSVGRWEDLSANSSNCSQATTAYRPLYKDSAINGNPGILFDGSDDYLTLNSDVTTINGATLFVVNKPLNFGGSLHSFRGNTTPNATHLSQNGISYDGFGSNDRRSGYITYTFDAAIYSVVSGNLNFTVYINGTQSYTKSNSLANQSAGVSQKIGAESNYKFNGYIGEVLVYDAALNSEQHTAVIDFLKDKWGIS